MKLNTTIEQAKEFLKTGEVVLVILKKEGDRLAHEFYWEDKEETKLSKDGVWVLKNLERSEKSCGLYLLRVGSTRSLCHKGKKIWYCLKCKEMKYCGIRMKPLQFTVESIEEKYAFSKEYWIIKGKVKG